MLHLLLVITVAFKVPLGGMVLHDARPRNECVLGGRTSLLVTWVLDCLVDLSHSSKSVFSIHRPTHVYAGSIQYSFPIRSEHGLVGFNVISFTFGKIAINFLEWGILRAVTPGLRCLKVVCKVDDFVSIGFVSARLDWLGPIRFRRLHFLIGFWTQ